MTEDVAEEKGEESQGPDIYGTAAMTPAEDVVAGRFGTWRLTYTAGSVGVAEGGGFRIYTDTDSDWGIPQFTRPSDPEFMTVTAPPGISPAVITTGVKSLRVIVRGRRLEPGESITLTYGDTSQGSPGSRAQTFSEERRYFWIDVDCDGTGNWQTLPHPPCLRIVGDEAVRLVVTAVPSTVKAGNPFRVAIKAEDRWGNPADSFTGTVQLSGNGFRCETPTVSLGPADRGVKWVENCRAERVGVLRITAEITQPNEAAPSLPPTWSNPVVVVRHEEPYQLFWADPHGGQLVLNEKFADFFRYARDVSAVQFVGFQRNADVLSVEDWEKQQQAERELTEEGRFIPLPGFEWSGRTWEGGHHNIYFRRHGQPARRNLPVEEMFQAQRPAAELPHIRDVYAAYRNTDTLITPHVGGEHSDLKWHEPTLEPAVEISSTHGSFEWMLFDALRRKYRLGFLGGSDCYTGRPGDDRPGYQLRRYAKSSLTGIYARGITLSDFFEAMRARRVYATTGARIVLSFDGDGHPLGSEYTTSQPPTFSVAVAGTAPLERLELFRGTEVAYRHPLGGTPAKNKVRLWWNGSSRMTSYSGVIWDGTIQVRGAALRNVQTVRFDSPRSRLLEQSDSSVTWHAWGCGYWQGLLLELDEDADPDNVELQLAAGTQVLTGPGFGGHGSEGPRRLSFAPAEGTTFRVRFSDVLKAGEEGCAVPLGVLDRTMTVQPVFENRPFCADFQVLDDEPLPGYQPYWLRVIQSDGEMAWSSPVFVDFVPGETAPLQIREMEL